MPGPLDALKSAYGWATTPLVPQSAIQGIQDTIDSPTEGRSPLEASVRGFGAGALEGLRSLTTPLDLASLAAGPVAGRLAKGAGAAAEAAAPTFDLVEAASHPQVMPTSADVDALEGLMKHNLAKIPNAGSRGAKVANGVQMPAEFATGGSDAAVDALSPAAKQAAPNPQDLGYRLIMRSRFAGAQ